MPTDQPKRSGTLLVTASAIVLAVAAFFIFHYFNRDKVDVVTATVGYGDILTSLSTNGKVEPIVPFQAHAIGPGIVKQIFVQVGQHVDAGQLIIRMDDADARGRLANAESFLQGTQSTYSDIQHNGTQDERLGMSGDLQRDRDIVARDQKDLEADKQLLQKGDVAPSEVTAAQQKLDLDEATLKTVEQRTTSRYSATDIAQAKARMADARGAVASAQNNLANNDIRTPISGTVYAVPVSQYDFVNGGADLADLADLHRLRIRAYFDEPDIGRLQVGQPVTITWSGKPSETWHGHVEITPTTVTTSGTRFVGEGIIAVDDANGDLLPYTNVVVHVTVSHREHVLSVPREAYRTDGGDHVFRVVDDKLVRTPITVGLVSLVSAEVVSGLKQGDVVALSAKSNKDLTDGMEVKPTEQR
jgi:HlyD family secretion protein